MVSAVKAGEFVLDVGDLRMRYGRADVLDGVTFAARRGEVLALLGPNGAGKTTTIEILEDPTRFVRELFRQYGESVEDLEVRRASLEDTYMALVRRVEPGADPAYDVMARRFSVVAG